MFGKRFSPDRWMSPPTRRKRTMSDPSAIVLRHWRYGIHPHAQGMEIRAMGRVELPLGEALRVEMTDRTPEGADAAHVQYYIVTHVGPWALWVSCARDDLDSIEAELHEIRPRFEDET